MRFLVAVLAALLLLPMAAYAQNQGASLPDIINANYGGPVFQDAFWTDRTTLPPEGTPLSKIEVAPGDGSSVLAVVLVNRGFSDITAVNGRLDLPAEFLALGGGSLAVASHNGIVRAGESFTLFFQLDVKEQAKVKWYNAPLTIGYSNVLEVGQERTAQLQTSFRVTGKVILDAKLTPDTVVAGTTNDVVFTLSNKGSAPATGVVINIESLSQSVQVLGDSKWNLGTMEAGSVQELATKVFSSTDMVGKATSFKLTANYLSAGQPRTEAMNVGAYVDGDISVRAYEIAVTYIGGKPNITGNLLNEGNTVALFTTVEVTSAEGLVSELPPQQYLGDLTENSPLPFSIPIMVGNAAADTYPVTLKVEYKDTLKKLHTLEVQSDVAFVPEEPVAVNTTPGFLGNTTQMIVIPVVVIAAVIAGVVIRTRKKAKLKKKLEYSKQNGDNIEAVLDSQLKRPEDRK